MAKTIAQQLGITEFPFIIKDNNGNEIYSEYSNGFWRKAEFDSNNREIYREYSNGFWGKTEFDPNDNLAYNESSDGYIYDNRPKEAEEHTFVDWFKLLNN